MNNNYYNYFESAEKCGQQELQLHINAFVKVFIEKSRRDRWQLLFKKRNNKLYDEIAKLAGVLNNKCSTLSNSSSIELNSGILFDFEDAVILTKEFDFHWLSNRYALVFSVPGQLVYFFTDDGDVFQCK